MVLEKKEMSLIIKPQNGSRVAYFHVFEYEEDGGE